MAPTEVATASCGVASAPTILTTLGIGSCVAICLYDPTQRQGALLHIMLPRAEDDQSNPYRYADSALDHAVERLLVRGARVGDLRAKIIGGAQMFKAFPLVGSIGERNIIEIRQLLQSMGIRLQAEAVGGNSGRSLSFDLATGDVRVSSQLTSLLQTV